MEAGSPWVPLPELRLAPTRSAADGGVNRPDDPGAYRGQRRAAGDPGAPGVRRILASANGDYRSLRLPGASWPRVRWRPRVAVTVTRGDLWVVGNHETLRYPVDDMVLASYGTDPRGAVRVDFLEGEPLIVRLDDDGSVLEALRHQIWECEKQVLLDGSGLDWALDVSPVQLAQADALFTMAMTGTGGPVGRRLGRAEREALLQRSEILRREARVAALRRRRRRMPGLPDGRGRPPEGPPGR